MEEAREEEGRKLRRREEARLVRAAEGLGAGGGTTKGGGERGARRGAMPPGLEHVSEGNEEREEERGTNLLSDVWRS